MLTKTKELTAEQASGLDRSIAVIGKDWVMNSLPMRRDIAAVATSISAFTLITAVGDFLPAANTGHQTVDAAIAIGAGVITALGLLWMRYEQSLLNLTREYVEKRDTPIVNVVRS